MLVLVHFKSGFLGNERTNERTKTGSDDGPDRELDEMDGRRELDTESVAVPQSL
jgi:hypothetical protein